MSYLRTKDSQMKPEDRDSLRKGNQPPGRDRPTLPGRRTGPPMAHPAKPIHIPLVFVTANPKDEGDRAATESLLAQCLDKGVYSCPRCDFTTTSPEIMVNHLGEEINKSLARLNEIYPLDKFSNESAPNPTP